MKRIAVLLFVSVGLLVACSGNDEVVQERDALLVERDRLVQERDVVIQERDAALQERDGLAQERDELQQQVADLGTRVDTLESERDQLESELATRTQELEATRQELLERTVERDRILADLQSEFESSLESVRTELQQMEGLSDTIETEREELRTRVDDDILPPLSAENGSGEVERGDPGGATGQRQLERLRESIGRLEEQAEQP